MPAQSQKQQESAGIALAAKRGEKDPDELNGPAKSMYESMSESELEEYASTSHEDKPEKKEDDNKKQGSEDNILNSFLDMRKNGIHKQAQELVNHRIRKISSVNK